MSWNRYAVMAVPFLPDDTEERQRLEGCTLESVVCHVTARDRQLAADYVLTMIKGKGKYAVENVAVSNID